MNMIDEKASAREMVNWLRGTSKNEVVSVILRLKKCGDYDLPVYGTKDSLLAGLTGIDQGDLWCAIDEVFPNTDPGCEDDEAGEGDDDDENEDDMDDEEE
jgi:hypothetical protein